MLTVREAAARLHLSRYTVYRMVQNGTLAAVRKPSGRNRVLIDPESLEISMEPGVLPGVEIPTDQLFLTPAEVARILRCGVERVRKMVNEGTLTGIRAPGPNSHMRIHAASVREYITGHRTGLAS